MSDLFYSSTICFKFPRRFLGMVLAVKASFEQNGVKMLCNHLISLKPKGRYRQSGGIFLSNCFIKINHELYLF